MTELATEYQRVASQSSQEQIDVATDLAIGLLVNSGYDSESKDAIGVEIVDEVQTHLIIAFLRAPRLNALAQRLLVKSYPTRKLSGYSYVPMRLKAGDENHLKVAPVKILKSTNCNHTSTVCVDCAWSWEVDYEVFYHRTEGGRRLESRKNPEPKGD